jgi:hypothetical protein
MSAHADGTVQCRQHRKAPFSDPNVMDLPEAEQRRLDAAAGRPALLAP